MSASRLLAPPSSTTGNRILLLFLVMQVCDGLFTYMGVRAFGPTIEANPIVAWYIVVLGVGVATISVKALAVGCAWILHARAWHRTLGVLTLWYFAFAVWPWIAILAPEAFR